MSSMSAHCFLGVELSVSLLRKQGLQQRAWYFGCRNAAYSNNDEGFEDSFIDYKFSREPDTFAISKISLGSISQEILNEILLPLIRPKQKNSKSNIRKQLMLLRLVSKSFKQFADVHCCSMFPDSFMHLILVRYTPAEVEQFFSKNVDLRKAFERITDIETSSEIQVLNSNQSDRRVVRIGEEYFEVLVDQDTEFGNESESIPHWHKEIAIEELKESLAEIQYPFLKYFTKAGVVAREDIDFQAFSASMPAPDFTFEDTSRFFLALKARTLESSYEEYGIIKSSTVRPHRDRHLQPLDLSPVTPHAQWILSRILSSLSRVGPSPKTKHRSGSLRPGEIAAVAELAGDRRLSWKFLSRASFTYI